MARRAKGATKMQIEPADMIVERRVDNPLTTWAQFLHELETGAPDPGLRRASVNLVTLMGGFCRFHGSTAQNEACTRYRGMWERAQLGGSRAIDPAVEPVDGGWVNPEATFDVGVDARMTYDRLTKFLDRVELARIHYVVIGEWGPTSYARWRYHQRNPDGRTVAKGQVEVRAIADRLARFFALA